MEDGSNMVPPSAHRSDYPPAGRTRRGYPRPAVSYRIRVFVTVVTGYINDQLDDLDDELRQTGTDAAADRLTCRARHAWRF